MKLLWGGLKHFFSGYFSLIASIASILGLIIVFIPNKNQDIIALIAFIVFLLIILWRIFYVTKQFLLLKTEKGEHRFATYVNYSTIDGIHVCYELHKFLQCKTFIINEHIHEFSWSGTKMPVVTSMRQDIVRVEKSTSKEDYDKLILKYRKPLIYNDFSVVHIKMDIDDSDRQSRPYCSQRIEEEIQLLSFRVELKNLTASHDAKIMRKKFKTNLEQEYQTIGFVPFDTHSRSYYHVEFQPEIGYAYKIDWS